MYAVVVTIIKLEDIDNFIIYLKISYLHNHLEKFLVLKVEHALHPNSEGLLTKLDAELFRHLVRVELILGGVLLVEEIHLNNDRGQVMLVRIELIRSHVNFLSITNILILLLYNICLLVLTELRRSVEESTISMFY